MIELNINGMKILGVHITIHPCAWCKEPVLPNEDHQLLPTVDVQDQYLHFHKNCFFRSVVGSVGHQQKKCSCYPENEHPIDDPEGMTRREAADAAVKLWEETQAAKNAEPETTTVIE